MRFLILGRSVGLKKKKAKRRVIRIISSGKWFNYQNYVVTFFFSENAKNLGPSDDTKRTERRKEEDGEKKRMALTLMDKLDTFILV